MSGNMRVEGITYHFGDRQALGDVSLNLSPGSVLALLGPNGAGKSTLIRLISGQLPLQTGRLLWNGDVLDAASPAMKRVLGYVPQDIALYPDLSARENLRLFGRLYGLSGAKLRERVEMLLSDVGLADRAGDRVDRFSGGMKRRLNLAASLVHEPSVLLLDEPSVGVDPHSRNFLYELIEKLRGAGAAILLTTHLMEEAQRLADRVAILDHGRVLRDGTPAELLAELDGRKALRVRLEGEPEGLDKLRFDETEIEVIEEDLPAGERRMELRLAHPRAEEMAGRWLSELTRRGVHFSHVEKEQPNLELLFLELTGRKLRD